MNRSCDELSGRARLAVVGAATPEGSDLRAKLADLGIPGARVDLYGTVTGESVISEYDGEARLIQDPDLQEIVGHEVVFLCESGGLPLRIAEVSGSGTLLIDVSDSLPPSYDAPIVHPGINPQVSGSHRGILRVPHALTILLAELLHPLDRELGVEEAVAVVLRPAADFGPTGIEELREQTVQLLNFSEGPAQTFGGPLAFNVIPQSRLPDDGSRLERKIEIELQRIFGWPCPRLTLRLMAIPVFFGHAVQLRLRLKGSADLEDVCQILRSGHEFGVAGQNEIATPRAVFSENKAGLIEVSEDGLEGFWIWAVAGEAASKSAEQAIRLARSISDW